jgi:hypothetical protein
MSTVPKLQFVLAPFEEFLRDILDCLRLLTLQDVGGGLAVEFMRLRMISWNLRLVVMDDMNGLRGVGIQGQWKFGSYGSESSFVEVELRKAGAEFLEVGNDVGLESLKNEEMDVE